jgi:hypothetical protein
MCKNVVCTNVTDRLQTEVSVISVWFPVPVAYSQVSLSVHFGGPEPKKNGDGQTQTNLDPIGGNTFNGKEFALEFIKRDRWHNSRTNMPYY